MHFPKIYLNIFQILDEEEEERERGDEDKKLGLAIEGIERSQPVLEYIYFFRTAKYMQNVAHRRNYKFQKKGRYF